MTTAVFAIVAIAIVLLILVVVLNACGAASYRAGRWDPASVSTRSRGLPAMGEACPFLGLAGHIVVQLSLMSAFGRKAVVVR